MTVFMPLFFIFYEPKKLNLPNSPNLSSDVVHFLILLQTSTETGRQ